MLQALVYSFVQEAYARGVLKIPGGKMFLTWPHQPVPESTRAHHWTHPADL